jgi:hypothetical protein
MCEGSDFATLVRWLENLLVDLHGPPTWKFQIASNTLQSLLPMNYARLPPDLILPIIPDERVMSYHKTSFMRIYQQLPSDSDPPAKHQHLHVETMLENKL